MAKIGGEASAVPEYKMPGNKKSIKAEALLKAAAKKNPAVTAMLNALKKLVPGLNVAAIMLDSDTLGSSTPNNPKATEAVAQYLFDNGGQWPDEGPGSFKEGYKGDKTEILNLYQAMVEQASLRDMAHEQDMKTSEKMPLYSTEQQEQMREAQKAYLRNM